MRKNVVVKVILLMITLVGVSLSVEAGVTQKKAKEKKPPKEMEPYELPEELPGTPKMDLYLLTCDTVYYRISTYRDSIRFFRLDTVLLKDGDTHYYGIKVVDQDGHERGWTQSIMQGLEMVTSGVSIVADALNVATLAVSALAENPLYAIKYRKQLKYGPMMSKQAVNEIGEITKLTRQQMKDLRAIYNNKDEKSTDSTLLVVIPEDEEINLEDLIDLADYDLGSDDGAIELPDELKGLDLDLEA